MFILSAVLSTLALMAPADASATKKLIWGPNELPNGQSAFPSYDRLGVDVLQLQLQWNVAAPERPATPRSPDDGAYRWPESVDVAVREARKRGIGVALQVSGSPGWANKGRTPSHAPDDVGDYADFLRAASRRYRSVTHWMIWGEPTRPGNFRPMEPNSPTGTRLYARLLDRAYGALKSADRRDKVIGGMTWTFGIVEPPKYIRWLRLPNGKPPRLDLWGHNPFSRRYPNIRQRPYHPGVRDLNDVDTLVSEVSRAYRSRRARPKLWLSEWTVPSDRKSRAFDFFVSRDQQAKWITAGFKLAGRAPYVEGLGWFNLLDDPASQEGGLTTGLMTHSGTRKPAFGAYARVR